MNGRAESGAAPSGVVTFLFTDIEGSTRRWEADPEVMRAALADHDDVLRRAIEAQGGRVFKHTGDGVCAVFTSPKAAIDAAVSAQQVLELPVRIGISTGEAELRGNDYFGAVLNRAARVMAAGHGGQILLDGLTAGLLRGVDLLDLGSRRLRDITEPVQVFQVRAAGLRTEFPPLTTQDPATGNLRPPTTSLIGREKELGEVATALKGHQVVTLTGPGGVGKTRLALEVAARSADNYPDGVWVIELAPVGDPAAVPEAFAAVLGIIQQPGLSLADSVAAALEGRSRLLLVDNCEHLTDAAAEMIENVLSRSSTVSILATSRQGLQVADEQLWPLPALDTTGVDSAAVTLFMERAQAVAPGTAFAGDEADAVVEICRRLDGIPLAIELAASRMASMTATEMRDRLDDRFRLLVGSRRGQGRHHTLRQAVGWSYDLLDEAEQRLLRRCSVFAGGFDLAGACAVSGSEDEFATLDLLDALVRKSLLVADRSSGRTRYSMLETIRQFADDHLTQTGEADEAHAAHARYFADQESRVLSLWDSPRQREAYTWLDVELANLRAAFRWAADHDDLDTAAAIAVSATFLGKWVDQYEPVGWAEELLEPAQEVDHQRLAHLYLMAAQCYNAGRIDEFLGYAEAGSAAIESGRYDPVAYEFESLSGTGYLSIGQPERFIELCRTVIARTPGAHTFMRAGLVVALTAAGATDEAIAASQGLLAVAEATGNPRAAAWALTAYSYAQTAVDPVAAYDVARRGLKIALDSGNRWVESLSAIVLSRLAAARGQPTDTFDYLTSAIRHYYDSGSVSLMSLPLAVLVVVFDRLGLYEPASAISGFAATPLGRVGVPEIITAIAHLREALGDQAYESLARKGEAMTTAEMVAYAYGQIDQARAALATVSE